MQEGEKYGTPPLKATEVDILNFKRLLEVNPGRGINRSDNPGIYEKIPFQ